MEKINKLPISHQIVLYILLQLLHVKIPFCNIFKISIYIVISWILKQEKSIWNTFKCVIKSTVFLFSSFSLKHFLLINAGKTSSWVSFVILSVILVSMQLHSMRQLWGAMMKHDKCKMRKVCTHQPGLYGGFRFTRHQNLDLLWPQRRKGVHLFCLKQSLRSNNTCFAVVRHDK